MTRHPALGSAALTRRYGPVGTFVAAVVLALFALPSSLILPQPNPGAVSEYAPVPGSNSSANRGNLASLGLGQSDTTEAGAGLPPPAAGLPPQTASTFFCVGNPPRQTEDPLSPPCVPSFQGDNGGATYPGVTSSEIRAVFYFDGQQTQAGTSEGNETTPNDEYDDIDAPPKATDDVFTRGLRALERYFDTRYQAYHRHVHFFAYYSANHYTDPNFNFSPTTREADAQANYQRIHPFAAFSYPAFGFSDSYEFAMAQHGVLNFGGTELRQASFYAQYPGLVWGYQPTVEKIARMYSSYVCSKLKPNPVSFAGDASMTGKPRKFGLLYTTDPATPGLTQLGKLVQQQVQACGVDLGGDVATFPYAGWNADSKYSPSYAVTNMAAFKSDNVTTVLWPGGFETNQSQAASNEQYFPEWVQGGDYRMEGDDAGAAQSQDEWSHAVAVTPVVPVPANAPHSLDPNCVEAILSVDPNASALDLGWWCPFYNDIREMFTGIQVAGPRLTPTSMNQGFHAIPPHPSSGPESPACYFDAGDYTCVKDAVAEWFDPTGTYGTGGRGCWRLVDGGRRHTPGDWPAGQVPAHSNSDQCTQYGTGTLLTT